MESGGPVVKYGAIPGVVKGTSLVLGACCAFLFHNATGSPRQPVVTVDISTSTPQEADSNVESTTEQWTPAMFAGADAELAEIAIATAKSYLGEDYRWDGRMTRANPGIDCLGLLFLAWGSATDTPWPSYPVKPSKLVASGLLGVPVPGANGVLRDELDVRVLQRGDVLYFLIEGCEIPDDPLMMQGEKRYWPWHTELYLDEGKLDVIHAEPGGIVRQQALLEIPFDALFATRPVTVTGKQPMSRSITN